MKQVMFYDKANERNNMDNKRFMTLLHNAIICLEQYGCEGEQLEVDIGITEKEYNEVMED